MYHLQYIYKTILFIEKQVEAKWDALLRKYRDEYRSVQTYHPSGSTAAVVKTSDWPLFKHMSFLDVHIQHRESLSSISLNSNSRNSPQEPSCSQSNSSVPIKQNFKRKRKSDDFEKLQSLLNNSEKMQKSIIEFENQLSENNINNDHATLTASDASIKKYSLLLKKGFQKISEENKFDCCSDIIAYIEHFKHENGIYEKSFGNLLR